MKKRILTPGENTRLIASILPLIDTIKGFSNDSSTSRKTSFDSMTLLLSTLRKVEEVSNNWIGTNGDKVNMNELQLRAHVVVKTCSLAGGGTILINTVINKLFHVKSLISFLFTRF